MIQRLLVWSIDETAGFDSVWARLDETRLVADGHAVGLRPAPFSTSYTVETSEDFVTASVHVETRWDGGSAVLDLRRADAGGWTVNGESRPDLEGAVDCDLAGCPLTNTMPVLRHRLLDEAGDLELLMAFIEVPSLRVVPDRQRYTHVRSAVDGRPAAVRYRSDGFESVITFDPEGFVLDYPQLGRRVRAS